MHGIQTSEPKESYMKTLISTLILLGTVSSAFAESNSSPKYSDEKCKQLNDSCWAATKAEIAEAKLSADMEEEIPGTRLLEAQSFRDYVCERLYKAEAAGKCD